MPEPEPLPGAVPEPEPMPESEPGPAPGTARAQARRVLTAEILSTARRHLVVHGADGLSLRAISRELGMVSSAIYRYFPSRDELLTALLIEAYDALGDTAERAAAAPGTVREQFIRTCAAVRGWAGARPQEWALLYGSPVPGYRAPQQTVPPASRLPRALLGAVARGYLSGDVVVPEGAAPTGRLAEQSRAVASLVEVAMPERLMVMATGAWIQLIGTVSMELFGQLVGSYDPADRFAEYTWQNLADRVGFRN